jgi:hypothetical protein
MSNIELEQYLFKNGVDVYEEDLANNLYQACINEFITEELYSFAWNKYISKNNQNKPNAEIGKLAIIKYY